ncbi:hypothetical protein ACFPVY_14045 [Flavobacterium qiangtangense]|uniref:Uncharacterized protein n=1 Tax=Flavobacterium qiangtangense TaxID=1442595 RepID=A0ABW1PRA1_9FLAO
MEKSIKDNSKINDLLKTVYSKKEYRIQQEEHFQTLESFKEYRSSLSYLVSDLKLVRRNFSNDDIYSLTSTGNEIIDEGGWLKHLENKKTSKENKILKDGKEEQLLQLEINLKTFEAKFEKRIIVMGLIFTILNFIVSVLAAKLF